MKLFSIVNTKGGVGKSSLTVAVAIVMALKKQRLLIIDLDDQRNSTQALIKNNALPLSCHSAYQLMTTEEVVSPHVVTDHLHVLPGSDKLVELDGTDFSLFHILRERVTALYANQYDIVMIDPPGHYNQRLVTTLTASDYVATPVELEYFSMQALERMTDLIRKVRSGLNKDVEFLGIIPNRVHGMRYQQPIRLIERQTLRDITASLPADYLLPAISEREAIRRIQDNDCLDVFSTLQNDPPTYQQVEDLTTTLLSRICP